MKRRLFGALLLVWCGQLVACGKPAPPVTATPAPPTVTVNERDFLLGGIQVNEPDHQAWFATLRDRGFDTVSVTVYAKHGDWDSANLWWEAEEPWVEEEIRGAKAAGLRVVLIPRVALDHAFARNRFLWHGMIMPTSDADLEEWFRRYREFVLRWARVAATHQVDVFGVGSELSALTSTGSSAELPALEDWYLDEAKQAERKAKNLALADAIPKERLREPGQDQPYADVGSYLEDRITVERRWAETTTFGGDTAEAAVRRSERRKRLDQEWRRVIAEVRGVYAGRLTYAANFDQYREVGFWDALDFIGINAYFPLRELPAPDATDAQLAADLELGWEKVAKEIDTFRAAEGLEDHQILFTELGYTRFRDMSVAPWAGDGFTLLEHETGDRMVVWREQPLRPSERALAIAALARVEAKRTKRLLAGALWWKLTTVPSHVEIEPFALLLGSGDPLEPALRELAEPVKSTGAP